jgi:rubrerythrin
MSDEKECRVCDGTRIVWSADQDGESMYDSACPEPCHDEVPHVTANTEKECPACGSIDICQDGLSGQNRGEYGWVCDHCGHEWKTEPVCPKCGTASCLEDKALSLDCNW